MLYSMTGFGGRETKIGPLGKLSVELRSINHKFLEIVLHMPEGFLSLEDKIKKEIEAQLKRGRVTCVINIGAAQTGSVSVNKTLLKKYASLLKNTQKQFNLRDDISLDTIIRLPGVLSLGGNDIDKAAFWPKIKNLLAAALSDLVKMRQKEGAALGGFLKRRAQVLKKELEGIKARFKSVVKNKISSLKSDEERSSFLKDTDISEELERLEFHIKNFSQKLSKNSPIGKELDFIAQEMQREANTIGAKSCDTGISAKVVQIKSQIEKIREQVQNLE